MERKIDFEAYNNKLKDCKPGCYLELKEDYIILLNRTKWPIGFGVIITEDSTSYKTTKNYNSSDSFVLYHTPIYSINQTEDERYFCKILWKVKWSNALKLYLRYPKLFRNICDFNIRLFNKVDFQDLYYRRTITKSGNISKVFQANLKFLKHIQSTGLRLAQFCTKFNLSEEIFLELKKCGRNPSIESREAFIYFANYFKVNYSNSLYWSTIRIDVLNDYWRMREALKDLVYYPKFPKDNSYKHLVKLHQSILQDYNKYQDILLKKSLQERQENYISKYYDLAKQFEFNSDTYSIIACKDLSDLCEEGKVLHHCVGSYTKSVSEGKEYILFLRKKDSLDTPYFTIDVTPDKICRQIHGFGNCNINSEIKSFIETWANVFNIDITNTSGVYAAKIL